MLKKLYLRLVLFLRSASPAENPKIKKICSVCEGNEEKRCVTCQDKRHVEEIDMTKSVTASQIYPIYKKWFRETYPQIPVVPKPRMVEILSTPDKLKKQRKMRWWGVIIRKETPPEISEF